MTSDNLCANIERGQKGEKMRTKKEVFAATNEWNRKTYKRYTVLLRYDDDRELIEFIENNRKQFTPTDIFRAGLQEFMSEKVK